MRELVVYVSADADMDPECELLGQLLAQLTPSVRWSIKRTPASHQGSDPDWATLEMADFYIILLGRDITAPIGVEWRYAREHGLQTLAYRNTEATPSPALGQFVRHTETRWTGYTTPQAFAADIRRRLCRLLIDGTPGYGLSLEEIEALAAELHEKEEHASSAGEDRRGAGQGGIILPQAAG